MKTCPACRKRISVRAVKCAYCHSQFDGAQMEDGRREHERRRAVEWLSAAAILAIAIYSLAHWLTTPGVIESIAERDARREIEQNP